MISIIKRNGRSELLDIQTGTAAANKFGYLEIASNVPKPPIESPVM